MERYMSKNHPCFLTVMILILWFATIATPGLKAQSDGDPVTIGNYKILSSKILNENRRNWVNSSVYFMNKDVLDFIPENIKYDFSYNLIPKLLESKKTVAGYPISEYWREVGTLQRYEQFEKDIKTTDLSKKLKI